MTDKFITDLPVVTSEADNDLMVVEATPGTTPTTSAISWANIKATLKTYLDTLYAVLTHTHTGGADSPKLAQVDTHESPDTDVSPSSIHHTLGTGANQAMAGNTPVGGSPGGLDTYVQFNDGGSFGGDIRFRFDKATGRLYFGRDAIDNYIIAPDGYTLDGYGDAPGGGIFIQLGQGIGPGPSANQGGSFTVYAGNGDPLGGGVGATGGGGNIILQAGTSTGGADGGVMSLTAGDSSALSGNGGAIGATAGNANGIGNGGAVGFVAGSVNGAGEGNGGSVTFAGGHAGSSLGANFNGGDILFQAGAGVNAGRNGYYAFLNPTAGVWGILDTSLLTTADKTFTFPNVSGTFALGAGTLTSTTANDVTVAAHTHAITGFALTTHDMITAHSYTGGAALDVFGLSAPNTIARLTPSSNPGAAAILRTDASGYLQLVRLGLGTAPSYPLDINGQGYLHYATTATAGDNISLFVDMQAVPIANGTGAYTALHVESFTNTLNNDLASLRGATYAVTHGTTATCQTLYAQLNTVYNTSSGHIVIAEPLAASLVNSSTGTIDYAHGVAVGFTNANAGGTIGNAYGFFMNDVTNSGTINLLVGLKIPDLTAGVYINRSIWTGRGDVLLMSNPADKLAFWGVTPIAQPTTAFAAATFAANTSGIANDTATWDSYTIGQVVKALRNLGLLA